MILGQDVFSMLEELEELVDRAAKIPLSGKVLVDDEAVFEIIDRIKASLPEEIKDAQWILNERQRIMEEAQAESQRILEKGRSYAEKLTEESEISQQAQAQAEDLVRQAQAYAQEVKTGSLRYADELFQYAESKIFESYQSLQQSREDLKTRVKPEEREVKAGQ
ncbi:MAG: ATPase [Peptococcaceae bacterium]|jgi:vacuolar-type H+-ATPase subunit H|nr:ATPase [Peptococcaceae bacterium]